jgi:acyl carrier protein
VAYIAPDQGGVPDINELRNFLKERLPEYMVPSAFVVLDTLPLTPNGKVDRRSLPAPSKAHLPPTGALAAPSTSEEKMLAKIWSEMLGIEQIGIHDNFFSLGGDSILSIRIIARANEAGIQLTPKQLFQYQTIAELAALASKAPTIQGEQGQGMDTVPPAFAQHLKFPQASLDQQKLDQLLAADSRIEDIYPLSPMQQNMLFHSLHAPKPGLYVNQTTLSLPRNLRVSAWEQAWQRVVDRHAILRTSFVWEGIDEPLQVVHQQVKIALEQYDWRVLSAVEQKERLQAFYRAERARDLDLSQAPLMRLAVIRLDEDSYQFIKTYHYLLLDGWSRALLWKEIFAFYEALCNGQVIDMGPCHPYRNYITWIKQQGLSRAEAFWRQMLRGFVTPTPLVLDQVSINLPGSQESYVEQEGKLSRAMTDALQSLAQQQHITMNTLVQGAWVLLLSGFSGEQDVVFGVTSSGRPVTLPGVDSMVGLFINTLPVRVQVPPEVPLIPWLKELQAQQAELRQYEYSSLLKVQEWSDMPPGLPLFESVLNFDNYPIDASLSRLTENLDASGQGIHTLAQTEFPLRVDAVPGPELSLEITYYRDCFADSAITRLLEHFRTLLEAIATNSEQRLGELMFLIEPTDPSTKRGS